VNRLFFMTSFSPLEAILSSFNWSENSRAGQIESITGDLNIHVYGRRTVAEPGSATEKVRRARAVE
ncbi:hypothetical protein, partial [Burkholderia pseudomallei]